MKSTKETIAAIFAIYMLLLTFLPCKDNCDSYSHQAPVTTEQAQDHHQEENDFCSPFCVCSCYSIAIVLVPFDSNQIENIDAGLKMASIDQPLISSFFQYIWQPPKIS